MGIGGCPPSFGASLTNLKRHSNKGSQKVFGALYQHDYSLSVSVESQDLAPWDTHVQVRE